MQEGATTGLLFDKFGANALTATVEAAYPHLLCMQQTPMLWARSLRTTDAGSMVV
jgi:hypothetical protein